VPLLRATLRRHLVGPPRQATRQAGIRRNPGVSAQIRSFAHNILKADKTATLNQDRHRVAREWICWAEGANSPTAIEALISRKNPFKFGDTNAQDVSQAGLAASRP